MSCFKNILFNLMDHYYKLLFLSDIESFIKSVIITEIEHDFIPMINFIKIMIDCIANLNFDIVKIIDFLKDGYLAH